MKFIKKSIRKYLFNKIRTKIELLNFHFKYYSSPEHINYEMFKFVFNMIGQNINILETGSSAWGCKSSHLFDNYIKKFGGNFTTVDIRPEAVNSLNNILSHNSKAVQSDSVAYIQKLNKNDIRNLDLVYLDSYDLDIYNPVPAMEHCLNEFLSLSQDIKKNALIIIDDTPKKELLKNKIIDTEIRNLISSGYGKGNLVLEVFQDHGFEMIYHEYSVVLRKI